MIIVKNIYNHRNNLDRSVIEINGINHSVKVYDKEKNMGVYTFDRYTVVYLADKSRRNGMIYYAMFGMSKNPFEGFGQHCEGMLGKHLGKKISFDDLPALCQKAVLEDLK